ncbi:MAG: hypothetical protein IT304_03555 [Dehalococcoidia bacterium]|nr:hypothetical protein [Dehalococcoidia bacterium]
MADPCAICLYLGLRPRPTTSTIGVRTALPALLAASPAQRWDACDGQSPHVVVAACPEHVVDVYRGRLAGIDMAWRIAPVAALTP